MRRDAKGCEGIRRDAKGCEGISPAEARDGARVEAEERDDDRHDRRVVGEAEGAEEGGGLVEGERVEAHGRLG